MVNYNAIYLKLYNSRIFSISVISLNLLFYAKIFYNLVNFDKYANYFNPLSSIFNVYIGFPP